MSNLFFYLLSCALTLLVLVGLKKAKMKGNKRKTFLRAKNDDKYVIFFQYLIINNNFNNAAYYKNIKIL